MRLLPTMVDYMIDVKLIHVDWTGPHQLNEIQGMTSETDRGLYQVCAWHPVFGPQSLVYIGETHDQTFGMRLGQHKSWLYHEREVRVYLGRIWGSGLMAGTLVA